MQTAHKADRKTEREKEMILKVKSTPDTPTLVWWYFGEIDHITTGYWKWWEGYIPDGEGWSLPPGMNVVLINKDMIVNNSHNPFLLIHIHKKDGSTMDIVLNTQAYLLNEQGKTIETLYSSDY